MRVLLGLEAEAWCRTSCCSLLRSTSLQAQPQMQHSHTAMLSSAVALCCSKLCLTSLCRCYQLPSHNLAGWPHMLTPLLSA